MTLLLDKKYFQRLIESSPDIIIAVDKSGIVNYYNDGARTSLGYSPEEMIGQKCTRIYPSIEEARRLMKAMRESADTGRINSFETEFRNKAGELIPIMISGALIYDDEGREVGSIGFARDIRRLRHAQQLATAGEIAVSLAHEINNPLESITNNIELLVAMPRDAAHRVRTSGRERTARVDSKFHRTRAGDRAPPRRDDPQGRVRDARLPGRQADGRFLPRANMPRGSRAPMTRRISPNNHR